MVLSIGHTDKRHRTTTEDINRPEWPQVEAAIRGMNGVDRNWVTLSAAGDDTYLGVGGGSGGRFYVFTLVRAADEWTLIGSEGEPGMTMIIAGGGEVGLDNRFLVPLDKALQAARTYLESATRDSALEWEEKD